MRRVLAHVHLFKNAGTSVERGLRAAFGDAWTSFDKPVPNGRVSAREIIEFVTDRPEVKAVSSHQLRPPFEPTDSIVLDPLVFLRHPIDRIRSAYEFERTQRANTPSSIAAASMEFAEWIEFHNGRGSLQCENFQVFALTQLRGSTGTPLRKGFPLHAHLASARSLLTDLRVTGTVEQYDRSCELISERFAPLYPGFRLEPSHANASSGGSGALSTRLIAVERSLGASAYEALEAANEADLDLWEWATVRLG